MKFSLFDVILGNLLRVFYYFCFVFFVFLLIIMDLFDGGLRLFEDWRWLVLFWFLGYVIFGRL